MIEGCLEWQQKGLAQPECVINATKEYLASQDVARNWLDECTAKDPQAETDLTKLYASWKVWCEENGEYAGSNRTLGQKLDDLGIPRAKKGERGVRFRCIRVLP